MKPAQEPRGRRRVRGRRTPLPAGQVRATAETAPVPAKPSRQEEPKGTPWGEKAQFYLAESQYQRGKLVAATTAYEKLVADYPGTEFKTSSSAASTPSPRPGWRRSTPRPSPRRSSPGTPTSTASSPCSTPTATPSQALEHVRHHDPTGPLADDAVLRIADEHMEHGDYETAAIYYDQLSPITPRARSSSAPARRDRRADQGLPRPRVRRHGLERPAS